MATQQWDTHHFEIERYLEKLADNPYKDELEEDLHTLKLSKLTKYIDDDCVSELSHEIMNNVYSICNTDDKLKDLSDKIHNEWSNYHLDNLDNNRKIYIIENILNTFIPNKLVESTVVLNPTKLRVSTMTVCSSVGCNIDTKYFYHSYIEPTNCLNPDYCTDNTKYLETATGIVGCKAENYAVKGSFKKNKKSNFFNSVALNVLIYDNKCINVKIFNNGKIQMTGVPSEEYGYKCINDHIIKHIKTIPDNLETGQKIVQDKSKLKVTDYRTVLINSDYFCGVEIQRENLFQILTEKYNLSVSYESENYPGVKLEYFWNKPSIGTEKEGRCCCSVKCKGKGSGLNGDLDCKKVTVSTFQSGKVIITGARSIEQINNAYVFINNIFKMNYHFVAKKNIKKKNICPNILIENSRFYFLKKTNIVNFDKYEQLLHMN